MRAYPAKLSPDPDGGFTVTFRDVPEAITEGDSRDEALMRAEDALESALAMYIAAKEPLPKPSAVKRGEVMVPLSALGHTPPPRSAMIFVAYLFGGLPGLMLDPILLLIEGVTFAISYNLLPKPPADTQRSQGG